MNNLHLVTLANNQPYVNTQQLLVNSIKNYTSYNVVFHTHNIETIKDKDWFVYLKDLPNIHRRGRRDGYYCAWKGFLVKDAYEQMQEGDVVYYIDSSKHFQNGIQQNFDKFLNLLNNKYKYFVGSISSDVPNSPDCCNDLRVWSQIYSDVETCKTFLPKPHLLCSNVAFAKDEQSEKIINEWVDACKKTLDGIPLVTYHHTVDQSLMNIIAYKHDLKVFYKKENHHHMNKDCNLIHKIINGTDDYDQYFINIRSHN